MNFKTPQQIRQERDKLEEEKKRRSAQEEYSREALHRKMKTGGIDAAKARQMEREYEEKSKQDKHPDAIKKQYGNQLLARVKDLQKELKKEGGDKMQVVAEIQKAVKEVREGIMNEKVEKIKDKIKVVDRD